MTDELNLPDEYKEIFKLVQHEPGDMIIEAVHDIWYRTSDILTALSVARDDLHTKDIMIGEMLQEIKVLKQEQKESK